MCGVPSEAEGKNKEETENGVEDNETKISDQVSERERWREAER